MWREFYDEGEYGLGLLSSRINVGKEPSANALTLRAVLPTESLDASENYPDRMFFYERDGGALFAHTQGTDGSRIYGHGKQLVVGFIATVGNYDYLYKQVFREDATFGFEADLHGEILNRTIPAESCEVCARQAEQGPGTYTAAGDQRFGTLVAPQMLGVYHQHQINLRLDFDIDGPVNAAKECNVRPLPADPEANGRGRAFTVEHTVFGTEKEAERILDPAADRPWMIYKQDLVFWYSLGFTHITKPEDYPIMPAGRASVNFAPEGFFARSPALGHATLEVSR